jgi:hypothetical protein
MHSMFFQLLFIHLFRPFLKYTQSTSPLPANVSPRKLCTQAAAMISKLMRLYKRSHGLRQICNVAVYIVHQACTIHLLNLPDKFAKRDVIHGVKHLEEIAEGWLCARRTLCILSILAKKWNADVPEEVGIILARAETEYGAHHSDANSPASVKQLPTHITQSSPTANVATIDYAAKHNDKNAPQAYPHQNSGSVYQSMPQSKPGSMAPPPVQKHIAPQPQHQQTQPQPQQQHQHQPQPQSQSQQQAPVAPSSPGLGRAWSYNSNAESTTSTAATKSVYSPAEMFGGVDQLIRDSQRWASRDQAQLANGFANWNAAANEMEQQSMVARSNSIQGRRDSRVVGVRQQPAYLGGGNGGAGGGAAGAAALMHMGLSHQNEQNGSAHMNRSMPAEITSAPNSGAGMMMQQADMTDMTEWLNAMSDLNSRATMYDEEDWYI